MNISLTPELEKFVQNKVAGGLYTSASEVIRESLRLMHTYDNLKRQRLAELNRAIDVGMEQLQHKQHIEGHTSHTKMKNKINKMTKGQE